MQRRFKLARKVGNASAGWRRRRGGVIARSRRLLADRRGESIPIGNAERLGDQLEALTDGDVETLGGEGRTQRACHERRESCACLDPLLERNRGASACVADPSFGQRL